jgi:hypothetical protein
LFAIGSIATNGGGMKRAALKNVSNYKPAYMKKEKLYFSDFDEERAYTLDYIIDAAKYLFKT